VQGGIGLKDISWENIEQLSQQEITYLLYKEGKSIKAISLIRNIDKSLAEKQIIEFRMNNRIFESAMTTEDIIRNIKKCTREERSLTISKLPDDTTKELEVFALSKLFESSRDDCSFLLYLLGEMKSKRAVPSIMVFLKSSDGNVKRAACSALGKIGDIRAEEGLISALEDKRPQVREYAIKALGRIDSRNAVGQLEKIEGSSQEKEYVKRAAKNVLNEIRGAEGSHG
jgi:HEAT repeat protein